MDEKEGKEETLAIDGLEAGMEETTGSGPTEN
jgi:hypothetical protein